MQSKGDVPPPYYGISSIAAPSAPIFHGDYKGVPVYEIGSNNVPIVGQPVFQQAPLMANAQMNTISVGRKPVHCICPQCHQQIVTTMNHDNGAFTWLMCFLLAVVGCIPCCLIPFCSSSCQDVVHTCPQCSAVIGGRKML